MPGTPFQMTYSEEMNKGIYLFTFKSGKKDPDINRIKLNLRIKTSTIVSPSEFAAMKVPDPTYELRIVIQGKESEIEGVKVSKQFKEFSKLGNVKLVLVPILDVAVLKKNTEIHESFINTLYKRIVNDQELNTLFQELLHDFQ
jgi:hypothetical protein